MTDVKYWISMGELGKAGWIEEITPIKNRNSVDEEKKYFFDVTFSYWRMGDIDPILDKELFEI